MKIFRAVLFLLLLVSGTAKAQDSLSVNGKITDSAGNALPGATVSLVRSATGSGIAFGRSDANGRFHFKVARAKIGSDAIAVKATYVGYDKGLVPVTDAGTPVVIALKQSKTTLKDVTVTSKIYVIQKSDTISFNADLFRDSTDKVLGDLIKKIPGIEVDENGTISYNGKALNNFYIEGDDLLDGKYNLATENIPSKYIDKVEVIEHNQHIKMLNGVVPSEQPALNIRLKDKAKLKWMTNFDLAAGTPKRYNGRVNSMAFKSRFKTINIANANNVGEDLGDQLVSHNSGVGTASPFINVQLSKPPGISQSRYLFNKNQMLNTNTMLKLRHDNTFRLNAYYLHDEQPFTNSSSTTYFLPGKDTVSYTEKQQSLWRIHQAQATVSVGHNTEKNYFNESLLADMAVTKNPVSVYTGNDFVAEKLNTTLTSFSNNLNGVFTVGKSRQIISYNSKISYSRNPQTFTVAPGWLPDLLNNGNNYDMSVQHTNLPSWQTSNSLSFIVNSKNFVFSNDLGIAYDNQQLNSDISIETSGEKEHLTAFENRMRWHKTDMYYLPNLLFQKNKTRINVVVPFHYYDIGYTDTVSNVKDRLKGLYLSPGVGYNQRIGKEDELTAGYRFGNTFSDINNMYAAGIMTNYRSIQSYYNTPIKSGYSNTYTVGFAYKRTLKMFFWNINFKYLQTHRYFLFGSTVTNTSYEVTTLPVANDMNSVSVSGDVSKYLFALKTNITARVSASQGSTEQYQNEALFTVKNRQMYYTLEVSPHFFKNWLRLDLRANYITGTSSSESAGFAKQHTSQLRQNSSVYVTPVNNITLQFSSEYFGSYLNQEKLAECIFLNSYINYRISKKDINLRLSCTNIANEKQFVVVSASSNAIATRNYQLQPRTLLMSVSFKL